MIKLKDLLKEAPAKFQALFNPPADESLAIIEKFNAEENPNGSSGTSSASNAADNAHTQSA